MARRRPATRIDLFFDIADQSAAAAVPQRLPDRSRSDRLGRPSTVSGSAQAAQQLHLPRIGGYALPTRLQGGRESNPDHVHTSLDEACYDGSLRQVAHIAWRFLEGVMH